MKTFLTYFFYFVKKMLGALLLSTCLLVVFLHTESGSQRLRNYVEGKLSELISLPVSIEKLSLASLHRCQLEGLSLQLPSGPLVVQSAYIEGAWLAPFSSGALQCVLCHVKYLHLPPMQLELNVQFEEGKMALEGALLDCVNQAMLAQGSAVLGLSKGILPTLDAAAPLHADVTAGCSVAALLPHSFPGFFDGQLETHISLSGTLQKPFLASRGKLLQGMYESAELACPQVESEFELSGPFSDLTGKVSCNFGHVHCAQQPPMHLHVDAQVVNQALALQAELVDSSFGKLLAKGTADVSLDQSCQLDLAAPISVDIDVDMPIAPLVNPLLGEYLVCDGQVKGTLAISGTLSEPYIASRGKLLQGTCESPLLAASSASMASTFQINGPLASLVGDIACSISETHFPELPPMELQLGAHFAGQSLALQAVLLESATHILLAQGQTELGLSTKRGVPYALDLLAPLKGNFTTQLSIAAFVNPLVSETLFIDGQMESSCSISGTMQQPVFAGHGKLTQGVFESIASGAFFPSVESTFRIDGQKLSIETFTARDSFNGHITGQGTVQLEPGLPLHLQLQLHQTALIHSDVAEGRFSGTLLCQGNQQRCDLTGQLQTDKLEIFLPERRPKEIGAIDVEYINQTEALPTQTRRKAKTSPVFCDIHILAAEPISIHGNGLTSEWKGNLAILGQINAPILDGEWRLLSGAYLFNGKKWALTQGTIALKGEEGKKSSLYTAAELEINSALIEVIVKGAFGDLALDFRSSPQMSQKEILCHILFGRGLREINAFQGAELSKSINKLEQASSFEGTDILTKIRNAFSFIDRVDFVQGNGDQEGLSLKIGSYVFPRLFVGVKKNFTSNVHGIEIEADITRNVKLQAEFGQDRDKQIHLKWKRDY